IAGLSLSKAHLERRLCYSGRREQRGCLRGVVGTVLAGLLAWAAVWTDFRHLGFGQYDVVASHGLVALGQIDVAALEKADQIRSTFDIPESITCVRQPRN